MKKILISLGSIIGFSLPVLLMAASFNENYLDSMIKGGISLVRSLVTLLIGLAIVWFIFNVVRYSMSSDEGGKEKAKAQMIYGIIAIAVCVSVWGIVGLLQITFLNGNSGTAPQNLKQMIPVI